MLSASDPRWHLICPSCGGVKQPDKATCWPCTEFKRQQRELEELGR